MGNFNGTIKKHRNHSLDLLKFIASFLIVCIHFRIFGETGKFVVVIARFAVPVFFMISGYYSYKDNCERVRKKLFNILKLYIGVVVLYFCFNVLVKVLGGQYREAIWYISTYFRIQYTSKSIIFNESITAMHLWFLGALIYSYVIRYFVLKAKIKDNIIYILSAVLLSVHLVLGIGVTALGIETPAFLMNNYVLRNFLFMGFPLFTLGQFIKKKESVILEKVSGKIIALILLLWLAESFIVYRIDWTKDLYFGSVFAAFALFTIALKMKHKTYHPKVIALSGTTTYVYLIHVMLGEIISMTILQNVKLYLCIQPFVVFAVSVGIALLLNRNTASK